MTRKRTTTLTKKVSPTGAKVLEHLMKTGEITGRDALLNMSIPNNTLIATVHRLRGTGYRIRTERRVNPVTRQRYAAFVLEA